jgi:hypothetical protein
MAEELIPLYNQMIQRGGSIIPTTTSSARSMRNVTPVSRAAPRLGMSANAARSAPKLSAGKLARGLVVAQTAYDLARLGMSENARQQAAQDVEDSAENDSALVRAGKGFINPVNTAYGIGSMIGDLMDSSDAAQRSVEALARGREEATPEMTAKRKKVQADLAANKAKKDYESTRQAALAIEAAAADAEANRNMSFQDSVESRLAKPDRSTNAILDFANQPLETDAGEGFDSEGDLKRGMEEMAAEQQATEEQPPKAKPVYDQKLLNELFKVATHSTFYGKNKGDVAMMGNIENLLDEYGGQLPKGMTPTQFALQLYRRL